jgi:hypothetical protein
VIGAKTGHRPAGKQENEDQKTMFAARQTPRVAHRQNIGQVRIEPSVRTIEDALFFNAVKLFFNQKEKPRRNAVYKQFL